MNLRFDNHHHDNIYIYSDMYVELFLLVKNNVNENIKSTKLKPGITTHPPEYYHENCKPCHSSCFPTANVCN